MSEAPKREIRRCKVCKMVKAYPSEFRMHSRECRACYTAYVVAKTRIRRAAQTPEMKAQKAAEAAAKKAAKKKPTAKFKHTPGPFEITLARLVQKWGPYRTWTRHQHALHTREIQKMTGLPILPDVEIEAARLTDADRTMPRQDSRLKARRAA